ncbi:MAG TPA: exonuclease domain-containing protein [Burkholderiaceae bacterium]|nr:exonuclease domain-containing protein [Burkholderiaceae bacterium]
MPHRLPALHRLSLRLRIFLLFAALGAGIALTLALGLYLGYVRNPNPSALNAVISGGILAGFITLGLIVAVWRLFDENVAKPIEHLAGELRARTHSGVKAELTDMKARHLGDLAPAATALMRHLNEARNELAEAIARETTQQVIEKERLLTLMADVPVGIVLCTVDHRVALYNGLARELLGQEDSDAPCLDRSLFDFVDEPSIRNAYAQLQRGDDPDHELEIVCTTVTGRPLIARLRLLVPTLVPAQGERDSGYVLSLERADTVPHVPPSAPRYVAYDFKLLQRKPGAEFADCLLEELTYVVFDTETTGLLPGQGDEIVQLAAVRIVNGKRIDTEVLDTLVNPGRPIPKSSTDIHGITDAMVADAPGIETVARRLHRFAQGAVLVAHNADFDLAFLRRDEIHTGVRFDHPVLDTVMLSAIVYGQSANHSLDALTARLDIPLSDAARHTALGDATATAEALLKLIPALKARGLTTLGDVLAETQRHGRLRRHGTTG